MSRLKWKVMSQEWIWQQPCTVKKANERTRIYEQQYEWQDSKHFPYVPFRISGGSNLSAMHKSKEVCLEIFQNTETDLENVIYEKSLRRLGLLNQKKEKERRRGTEEGFYKQKMLLQTGKKKLFFISCGQ